MKVVHILEMIGMLCSFDGMFTCGRTGDCEGRNRNLSFVIGFGLCVNGMNWPFFVLAEKGG